MQSVLTVYSVWSGYRDAQLGWIEVKEDTVDPTKTADHYRYVCVFVVHLNLMCIAPYDYSKIPTLDMFLYEGLEQLTQTASIIRAALRANV